MEEQLKEIEGLLETTTDTVNSSTQSRIKKYIKLVFPHVALVAVVCLYAVIGAYIFYRLESPNEDRLKTIGKNNIGDMRMRMLDLVKRRDQSKRVWKDSLEEELYRFNDKIYKAFKEQYVRYPDVRVSNLQLTSADKDDPDRTKRHRNTKSRADKGEKMWTASSALFFAATTMATIGYGNIVPATSSGRIACVVFALFGAPLAIITIGDLGKFLSECTIWLYKQMKKAKIVIKTRWKRLRGNRKEDCEDQSDKSSTSTLDWEELVMDKTEVPVLMVFTILLLYIAFGGVLFSFLEGWSYMDAFYYSFISLTTIGFGDIVPENHDYIVLMLMYLGVGLAVTTMCIDLVGIQYIQKIHYFGRKFRGTDLLHLLKRKRMIERRLAMGQGEEILQMYMHQMQQHMPESPLVEDTFEEKCPSPEWAIDDTIMKSRCSISYPQPDKVPSPNILSIRSFRTPSIYSNSSASARSMMFNRYFSRGASWDESGPSLSEHCSLSTEPSVYAREAYWENFRSPDPSVTSFEFEFPLPSPDYSEIAAEARRSRRILSCPAAHFSCPPPSVRKRSLHNLQACEGQEFEPLYSQKLDSFRISEPFMLSKLAVQCDIMDLLDANLLRFQSPRATQLAGQRVPSPDLHYPQERTPLTSESVHVPRLFLPTDAPSTPVSPSGTNRSSRRSTPRFNFRSTLFPIPERRPSSHMECREESPEPLLKRKKRERLEKLSDPLHDVDWLNISPRSRVLKQIVRDDLPTLFNHVRESSGLCSSESQSGISPRVVVTDSAISSPTSVVLVSPRNPIGLACMEDWDSYIQMLEEYEKPYERGQYVIEDRPKELRIDTLPLLFGASPITTPTFLLSPPEHFAASPCPPESCAMSTTTSPLDTIYYLPQAQPNIFSAEVTSSLYRMTSSISSPPATHTPASIRLHSPAEMVHIPPEVPSIFLELEVEDQLHMEVHEDALITARRNSHVVDIPSEEESTSGFDLDLGAFELVDSGLSAETLLNTEDPVIFHQDMPVHSVHHDTVQTEAALANLMSAPSSMLTGAIPPTMVEDNYCFVVDGERVRMGDILGDDQWWRHTSRPTKYFYSEDLRQFHRVNCITAKGKVITAKLASGTLQVNHPTASSSSTPRSSVSGTSSKQAQNKVCLTHVYKVIRFYSFWKTCTSFHRIVTMIDKVSADDRNSNPAFKKRLFVQYLWRNAKAVEKARVQKEFDPRRQRLLRFVTDSAQRKRFVEDESCMFAVILDESETMIRRGRLQRFLTIDSSSRDESEDSIIDFPVEVNACPVRLCKSVLTTSDSTEEERAVLYHYGNSCEPIPVFSVDEKPLDGPSTLTNTIRCPIKYISKIPPSMVVDNFCFICDGDEVSEEEILSDQQWWKQTSCSTRFYSSENMTTFHQVTLLTCRGEMRGAYRSRARGAGIQSVSLNQVFRVSRYFSSWRTCTSFHRIVSVISPITLQGENSNNFKKRIFVQYFWRQEKPHDREMVTREYLEFKIKSSPRHSLVPPSTSLNTRSWSSRSHYPGLNPYTSTASTSSLGSHDSLSPRAQSRWNILGKALKFSRPRRSTAATLTTSSTTPSPMSQNNNKRFSVDDALNRQSGSRE